MTAPYFQDDAVTLWHGDSLPVMRSMTSGSVDCIVTSPPYFGLRDYGVERQLGAEATPAEYVGNLRALFTEARRVLADDGTLWLNLGDSYGKDKNLLGIPWRVAFALQDDRWGLRNDIIWHKPNAMPESVADRLSGRHEHLFMFAKSQRYWFDLDAVRDRYSERLLDRHARATPSQTETGAYSSGAGRNDGTPQAGQFGFSARIDERGKNPGDVWSLPTQPFPGAHFATFPLTLPERCILAGCKPGGTVLDPFSGSGTTGMAAAKHGRRYVGIDLNAEYLDLSLRTRLQQPGLDIEGAA